MSDNPAKDALDRLGPDIRSKDCERCKAHKIVDICIKCFKGLCADCIGGFVRDYGTTCKACCYQPVKVNGIGNLNAENTFDAEYLIICALIHLRKVPLADLRRRYGEYLIKQMQAARI